MKFLERVRIAMEAFRGASAIDLPPSGRSSDESLAGSMSSYLSAFGSVSPVIDFQLLDTLKHFWLYNPDMSQYVANIVNLGNPGHSLSIDAKTDAIAEAAVNRLNESATRLYPHGCGIDGLLTQYLQDVAWSGAVSSEDVVNIAGRRVEKVVIVPVEKIRFVYDQATDSYQAHQQSANPIATREGRIGLIKLNAETYKYLALSTVQNSPYAKPPATAAVEAILAGQKPLMDNLRYIAQKFGLLALAQVSVMELRRQPTESEQEYQARATAYLAKVSRAMEENFSKGIITTYRNVKIDNTSLGEGARGLYDANRISEEQVMSGLAMQPVFFGRTDSSTETFADVVYSLLVAQVASIQRIVKRRQEQTYRLDLRLAGIEVDAVNLSFEKAHSRNAKSDAETDEIRFRDQLARVKSGLVTPDEAAQALGYDAWADDTMLAQETGLLPRQSEQPVKQSSKRIRLSFDRHSNRYRPKLERIELWSGTSQPEGIESDDRVVPFIKKKSLRSQG